jgi:VanZ family protein
MRFISFNWITRCFYLVSIFVVYLIENPILYFYILFFFLNVEILLRNKTKSDTRIFKYSQLFFIGFVAYFLFVRSFIWGFSDMVNYHLNSIEHLLFALVVSLMILYHFLFFTHIRIKFAIWISIFIFNGIGLINEFFQNYFQGKAIFYLESFSVKDLLVNLFGTLLFLLGITLLSRRMSVLNSIEK